MSSAATHRCFSPVLDAETKVMILGSLPGQASLFAGQYYAHPRNQFWRLLGDVLQQPLMQMTYRQRLQSLRMKSIGLWDVIASAKRRGSLDANLQAIMPNDLAGVLDTLPALRAVAFNGTTAARAGKQLADRPLALLYLPSSSPAYTLGYTAKLAVWYEIRRYL